MNKLQREVNATAAIALREIIRYFKEPGEWVVSLVFPLIFIGILGETLSQNLGENLGYNYLQFVLIGMMVNVLFQATLTSVTSLIEDRENNFTQEIFVSPISRYSIILGKIVGGSITSLFGLVSVFIIAMILRIPLTWSGIESILLVAPIVCLAGGALGIFAASLFNSSGAADKGTMLIIFPQMFLAGVIIPVRHSTGILGFLAHIMPLTYLVDLARGMFYHGTSAYQKVVIHSPGFDLAITSIFFVVFVIIGTYIFTRKESNR
jgi:ABC-2 type transport system permease protein